MTVLAFLAIWAGLIAFLLLAVNRYRDALEQRAGSGSSSPAPPVEIVVARIQRNGMVHMKEKPHV